MKIEKTLFVMFAMLLFIGISNAEMDFTPEGRDSNLGFLDKWTVNMGSFTIAGQQRECSVYPINAKVLEAGFCGSVGSYPNLINIYTIPKDGGNWLYISEKEAPTRICGAASVTWAYEEYKCDIMAQECTGSEKRCVTDKKFEVCENNQWVGKYCPGNKVCSYGNCIEDSDCQGNVGSCWSEKQGHHCSNGQWVEVSCGEDEICNEGYCTQTGIPQGDDPIITPPMECIEGWFCLNAVTKAYQFESCGIEQSTFCEYGCESGMCKQGDTTFSNLEIVQINVPRTVVPGSIAEIDVKLRNPSSQSRTVNIEAGIYRSDYVKDQFGMFSIAQTEITPCGGMLFSEKFVSAHEITISGNSEEWIHFIPQAPTASTKFGANAGSWALKSNWEGEGSNYEVIVGIYEKCGEGYLDDWASSHITVESGNGGETIDECTFFEKKVTKDELASELKGTLWKTLLNPFKILMPWSMIGDLTAVKLSNTEDYCVTDYVKLSVLFVTLIGILSLIGLYIYFKLR